MKNFEEVSKDREFFNNLQSLVCLSPCSWEVSNWKDVALMAIL